MLNIESTNIYLVRVELYFRIHCTYRWVCPPHTPVSMLHLSSMQGGGRLRGTGLC